MSTYKKKEIKKKYRIHPFFIFLFCCFIIFTDFITTGLPSMTGIMILFGLYSLISMEINY